MNQIDLRVKVLLGMQVALLGAIGEGVRKILCQWNESEIRVRAIFDGEICEAEAEAILEAETEMMANFVHHNVSFVCERCDVPNKISQGKDECAVFARLEA